MFILDTHVIKKDAELIDTLWNVNNAPSVSYSLDDTELIDTLWNVNMKLLLVLLVAKQELIDTLWNVNIICDTF